MKITSLQLNNFKSIKIPANISFSHPLISLVGKNGSGKTNILDAIHAVFNSSFGNNEEFNDYSFKLMLALETEEIDRYKDFIEINESNNKIEAYKTKESQTYAINVNRIKAPILYELLNQTEESIYKIAANLKGQLEQYNDIVKELVAESYDVSNFTIDVIFTPEDLNKSTNYGWIFESLRRELESLIDQVKRIVSNRVSGDDLVIDYHHLNDRIYYNSFTNFELKYIKPKLTRFEARHITIDEKSIKQEIEKINQNTKAIRDKIDINLKKLKEKLDILNSIILDNTNKQDENDTMYESILRKIYKVCSPKIYYLRNENNQLFFRDKSEWGFSNRRYDEKAIVDMFITYNYSSQDEQKFKEYLNNNKLSPQEMKNIAKQLEKVINESLPEYEKQMLTRIKVADDLSLFTVEKNGDSIPFSQTNAGRKWFFTYFFIKGCLRPGDILLMDEPANNLHPEAQIHIRKELEEISKHNKIVISTHSPYMISPKSFVYYVEMTDEGTNLDSMDNIGIHQMSKNLGIFDSETVIGDILINNQLLSFEEIGKRLRDVFKEIGVTQQKVADGYGIDERSLRKKLTGKHLTFSDIEWFIKTYNINPVRLLLKKHIN